MNTYEIWKQNFGFDLTELNLGLLPLYIIDMNILEYFPSDHTDITKMQSLSCNKFTIMKFAIDNATECSAEVARLILQFSDSFNRPELLLSLSEKVSSDAWLDLFREYWTSCDSCSLYHEEFRNILFTYNIKKIREKTHSAEDKTFYDSLPESFEVYRGTFIDEQFIDGISWTTDKEIAERFKNGYENFKNGGGMRIRYMINMNQEKFSRLKDISESGTTVLTKTVNKKDVFVNTSRGEHEILILEKIS